MCQEQDYALLRNVRNFESIVVDSSLEAYQYLKQGLLIDCHIDELLVALRVFALNKRKEDKFSLIQTKLCTSTYQLIEESFH